ncbi:MAG TPA: anhydro-N-acetylmuramic acid kinase [Luteimonas sp.]|nr:anhydro-N-acetylmuramic acid kinase [Luteimonas sp.]
MPVPTLYLGLISGTSADGIDAAIVSFDGEGEHLRPALVAGATHPWEPSLRARLVELGQADARLSLDDIGELDCRIGMAFAEAANATLSAAGICRSALAAIGSHGQTLRHRPLGRHGDGRHPYTMQLGDANVIAERTQVRVVADFRRRDVAAGGHGAPLVPALHAALLHAPDEDRAVLNLGGIANLTLLPAEGGVRGFDTGPANGLMDAWALRTTGEAFDRDGALAARGRADPALLACLLDDAWYALPPPKSTGRDQFHLGRVDACLRGDEADADVQATLLALTVRTIVDALRAAQPATRRLLACGGGVHNPTLMAALAAALPGVQVESSAVHGVDPDYLEAMAFAWLARQTVLGRAGNLPGVSGAAGPRVLGAVYAAN